MTLAAQLLSSPATPVDTSLTSVQGDGSGHAGSLILIIVVVVIIALVVSSSGDTVVVVQKDNGSFLGFLAFAVVAGVFFLFLAGKASGLS